MKKKQTRREFIELGAKAGLALPLLASGLYSCTTETGGEGTSETVPRKKLKILILGGTSFLGPHQIAYALAQGHEVSIFTRGKTKPSVHQELFEQVEQLVGDRNDDLTALENRKWDAVIDNSGRETEWTKSSAALLKENCELYLYTSSTGVYYPYLSSDYKEDDEVVLEAPEGVDLDKDIAYWYGIMKANSELAAMNEFGKERTIIVRPTYMFGPADRTNRFIHWPIRLSQGGEVLVPGKEEDLVQYIDVRDVAEWMIRLIENRQAGVYNAVGPKEPTNMYSFVEEAQKAFEVESTFVKIDDYDFLEENKVFYIVPWIMPTENDIGSAKISNQKALANGLSLRPLSQSIKDTYDWWYSDALTQEDRDKVEADPKSTLLREKELIEKWKALQASKG
ncbi:MAG: SDR family oxidoreductase [Saprospiraceae bacterium]